MFGNRKRIRLLSAAAAVAALFLMVREARTQVRPPQQDPRQTAEAAVRQYCVGCHSAKLKTGGVVLDPATLGQPAADAETWERAIKQLRARSMPPVPMPRPDAATYEKVASYLETELDRAAAAKPNPGDLPNLHRLTRTEYSNAIRDLLAVDNLPNELPCDASQYFGLHFEKYILPELLKPESDILHRATICENGRLTPKYEYLADYAY